MIPSDRARRTTGLWVKPGNYHGDAARLFCIPHAGGGASAFASWSAGLPPEIEICPIALPGREQRIGEAAYTQLTPLVEQIAAAVRPWLDRPYAIFGHSMGAMIGFELARWLRREGCRPPTCLFVSSLSAPHRGDSLTPIHHLPEAEFLAELIRRYDNLPEEMLRVAELRQYFAPILRADFTILETYNYRPEPPLECSIRAFGGMSDPGVSRQDLEAWSDQTRSSFEVQRFPGGHFYYRQDPMALFSSISRSLRDAIAGRTGP
jgi:medium-chain acyl-[acyl-carrier-protein] hydrolase